MVTKIFEGLVVAAVATQDAIANPLDVRTQTAATKTLEELAVQTEVTKNETTATTTTSSTITAPPISLSPYERALAALARYNIGPDIIWDNPSKKDPVKSGATG